jgi:hypothetical protein
MAGDGGQRTEIGDGYPTLYETFCRFAATYMVGGDENFDKFPATPVSAGVSRFVLEKLINLH